jgi:hypothetical protein
MSEAGAQAVNTLGDRHLRGDRAGRLADRDATKRGRVAIVADESATRTLAGQRTLWMAANLLARQYGMVHELVIAVAEAPLQERAAYFGAASTLGECLERTANAINPTLEVTLLGKSDGETDAADFVLQAGPKGDARIPGSEVLPVWGSGWTAAAGVGVSEIAESALGQSDDGNPIGSYFAASLGAGEAFKRLRGMRPGRGKYIESLVISLWKSERYKSFADAPSGPAIDGLVLPPAYLIGVGAVGQAFVATIASSGARGHVTLIDPETIDNTNPNRYVLVTKNERGGKADIAASVLKAAGFTVFPYRGTWPGYAYDLPHREQQKDLQRLESEHKYEWVISAVDKNVHRHAIQKFWPRHLLGGSTDDFLIQVSAYDMGAPFECLMCHNPPELPSDTIEKMADKLQEMTLEERGRVLRAAGLDAASVEHFLRTRKCGEAGEQELVRFANRPSVADFSVGFVSVASGVLLAAQFLKVAIAGGDVGDAFPAELGHTLRFSFVYPDSLDFSMHRRRNDCTCGSSGRTAYRDLWNE